MHRILQWNCQGYRSKYEDMSLLLNRQHPSVVLLQETMLNNQPQRSPRGYTVYSNFNNPSPGHGFSNPYKK